MARKGQLSLEQYGATMPVVGEAVQKPPFYYRNMEMMFVIYRTDEDAAAAMLPDALELDEPALVTIIVAYYGASTFGPYHEAMLSIRARLNGEVVSYYPALFTDNEAPLIGGREIWGFAKKLAKIELRHESEVMMGLVERPTGKRLLTATMRNVTPVTREDFQLTPSISLKMIPCATDAKRPALAQLIRSELELVPHVGVERARGYLDRPWLGSLRFSVGNRPLVPLAGEGSRRLLFRAFRCGTRAWHNRQRPVVDSLRSASWVQRTRSDRSRVVVA